MVTQCKPDNITNTTLYQNNLLRKADFRIPISNSQYEMLVRDSRHHLISDISLSGLCHQPDQADSRSLCVHHSPSRWRRGEGLHPIFPLSVESSSGLVTLPSHKVFVAHASRHIIPSAIFSNNITQLHKHSPSIHSHSLPIWGFTDEFM